MFKDTKWDSLLEGNRGMRGLEPKPADEPKLEKPAVDLSAPVKKSETELHPKAGPLVETIRKWNDMTQRSGTESGGSQAADSIEQAREKIKRLLLDLRLNIDQVALAGRAAGLTELADLGYLLEGSEYDIYNPEVTQRIAKVYGYQ